MDIKILTKEKVYMKFNFSTKSVTILIILVSMFFINGEVTFANETNKKYILILNSYHQGYPWTDNAVQGINNILKNDDNVIRIEYMDNKIIKDEKYLNSLYELFKYKFRDCKFDVIIGTDNDAYEFLKKYHKELFKDTPVICSGLNTYDDFITNKDNGFTGIAETIDIKDTLDLAFNLQKNVKNVIITSDCTLSGNITVEIVQNIMHIYGDNKQFYFFQSDSIEEHKNKLKEISSDSIVLQVGIYKDKVGNPITLEQGNKIIAETVNVPVYSCWEMSLGNGIIGGKMIGLYDHGELVGKMALEILNGKKVKEIPFVKKSPNKYIFDYNVIKKYNIDIDDIPLDSVIKNKPSISLEIPKSYMYIAMGFISVVLVIINFFLFKNIINLRKVKKDNIKEKKILEAILESNGNGILVADNQSNVIHINNKFAEMWKIPKEMINKKDIKVLIDFVKEQVVDSNEFVNGIEHKNKVLEKDTDFLTFKDGKVFERLFNPLIVENQVTGVVWSFKDITKRIELERLQKEMEFKEILLEEAKEYEKIKDQFFSTISHELKTPLNIILGVVQLVDKTFCEDKSCIHHEKLKKYMDMSRQNCYRLVKLINNLIDITKIDSGFMTMNFKNYNVVSIIENITLSLAEYIESKGIELIFDTEMEEKIIGCDAEKLERVMLNLLSNAVKFTDDGGTIMVNIYEKEESIIISVKDTGIGIPSEMKEKIFDRFTQVDCSLRRRAEGNGIGLSLVKSIVDLHHGTITLESSIGIGSEFIIELPVLLSEVKGEVQEEGSLKVQSNVERISIEFSDIYS